jgi:enamine deaminase RidA (YjgF/YER057c/UK114 family)
LRGVRWLSQLICYGPVGHAQRMPVQLLRPDRLFGGVPYAYASIAQPGAVVYTAGACPLDKNGATVGVGDVEAQAQQAMANLVETLAQAGTALTEVLKTTIYVASSNRSDLVTAWEVIRTAFGEHDAPSTLLGVAALGYPDQLVEIEAIALMGSSRRS